MVNVIWLMCHQVLHFFYREGYQNAVPSDGVDQQNGSLRGKHYRVLKKGKINIITNCFLCFPYTSCALVILFCGGGGLLHYQMEES